MRILVFGDSYANFNRFDAAIERAHAEKGIDAKVESLAFPGSHCGMLARRLGDIAARQPMVRYDKILLLTGVNDIVRRRGVAAFRSDLERLVTIASQISPAVFLLEIPMFDEHARVAVLRQRLKQALFTLLFDRQSGRVQRYRAAAERVGARLISTSEFLPGYDPSRFKDGIHLTDEEFRKLAGYVAGQLTMP